MYKKSSKRKGAEMEQNILVRTLGDSHFLKVLGFFLEHPVHKFNVSKVSRYLGISRDTVRKDIEFFEALGYVERTSRRGPYRLRLDDEMVATLLRCVADIARTLGEGGAEDTGQRLYIPHLEGRKYRAVRTSTAGA